MCQDSHLGLRILHPSFLGLGQGILSLNTNYADSATTTIVIDHSSILSATLLYYSGSHKMKGTAHALFRVATRKQGRGAHSTGVELITGAWSS